MMPDRNDEPTAFRDASGGSLNRLFRDPRNGIFLGVCAGIAGYFGVERWVVRLATVVALLMFTPATILAYLVLACILPRAPERLYDTSEEARFWRNVRVDPARSFSELRHRFRGLEHRLRAMEAYVTSEAYRVNRDINDLDRPSRRRR
ncbi:MAG: envelope stress response membrane protein PspC [Rhodospirillales bacterium]|nr:MAG: envelope stress response membrane protein PspC [Rhodospirillales bacterium]